MKVQFPDLKLDKKTAITVAGVVGGLTVLGVAGVALWNSKSARTARTVKRTGHVLNRVGTALQSVSQVM